MPSSRGRRGRSPRREQARPASAQTTGKASSCGAEHPAAVDPVDRARDEGRLVRGEVESGARDVLGLAEAAEHGHPLGGLPVARLRERLPRHRGDDRARHEDVGTDAARAVVLGDRPGQRDDAALRGRVRVVDRLGTHRHGRGRVDHAAPAGPEELRNAESAAEEDAGQVDGERPVPDRLVQVDDGAVAGEPDPGVVVEHVQGAERFDHLAHGALDVVGRGDVCGDCARRSTRGTDRSGRRSPRARRRRRARPPARPPARREVPPPVPCPRRRP